MTELETIARAKMYMDKLAKGINPLDGARIPAGEVAAQDRMSRCFSFVSGILGQVLDNGGVTASPLREADKIPFALSREQREAFACSEAPVSVSEIAKRLNALKNSGAMRNLNSRMITNWLLEAGMLTRVTLPSGEEGRRPTPEGRKLGIAVEDRRGAQGMYQAVVYNAAAQRFVADNLEAIAALEQTRLEMRRRPWTPEEDARLRELFGQEIPVRQIARELQRLTASVRARLRALGIVKQ